MPFTTSGINFKMHIQSLRTSTLKLFFGSSKNSRSWTPLLRLVMFKIFYRSKYEYASPLLLASEASLAPLQKLQDMLLKWVNYGHAGSSINHAMTGMPPIANRVQELGMRFQYFTKTMHVENPLRLLLTHLRSLPTLSPSVQRQLLYSLVQPSPMYQRYRTETQKLLPWISYTFTDFNFEERITLFQKDPLVYHNSSYHLLAIEPW